MKILFVDDDQDMREMAELALGFEGIEALTAGDMSAARAILHDQAIDAIVCDFHLGRGATCAELLAEATRACPGTPFLVVSGDISQVGQLDPAPARVLQKPIELEALAATLKALHAAR